MARHRFAVLALAALSLASVFWALLDVVAAQSRTGELFGVDAFEARFNGIRPVMKPHTTFGYVSDNPATDPTSRAEYYLTQYTLAPAIIRESLDERLNIGNMHNQQGTQQQVANALAARHLVPVQDFGNGIRIYRNNYAK